MNYLTCSIQFRHKESDGLLYTRKVVIQTMTGFYEKRRRNTAKT